MQKRFLFLLAVLYSAVHLRAADVPVSSLSGTYLVGNSQSTYKKLTDVANALNNSGVTITGNVVFELDSDYEGTTGESFPIVFNQFNTSGNWTVTIRPKAGVTMRTTSGNPGTQALITLNGTDRLILDGRAGGSGSIAWLIRNTATTNAEATILLQNDAQKNTLTYLQLEGQTMGAGVVHIGTSGAEGNDDNLISYCAIRDRTDVSTPARPVTGILSLGSEASTGNRIDHNNIFNFFNDGGTACGIRLAQGTTDASVTYNNIYQEQPLPNVASGTSLCGIQAGEWSTNRLAVTDNFIGGSAPGCGGAPLTIASAPNGFCNVTAISYGVFNAPFAEGNVCNRNTIRNMDITIHAEILNPPGAFTGIIQFARTNIEDNIIGNPDGHDDIKITAGTGTAVITAWMIEIDAGFPVRISGNKMGGITLAGKTTWTSELIAIGSNTWGGFTTNEPVIISDNTIGSVTITDNIRVVGDSLPLEFWGIKFGMAYAIHCTNNTIGGVSIAYAGAQRDWPVGMSVTSDGDVLIRNNLISGISSASLAANAPYDSQHFTGITGFTIGKMEVSGNIIRGLHLTGSAPINAAAGKYSGITGIKVNGYAEVKISGNQIYDLVSANVLGASSANIITAIRMDQTRERGLVYNNLIALDNGGLSNNCEINGILIKPEQGHSYNNVYHNTIYIGGKNGALSNTGISSTVSYTHQGVPVSARSFFSLRNNLLVNARTEGNGAHYIYRNETPADNWTASSSDTNVLVIADMARVGRWATASLDSTQWKGTGGDANSWFYNTVQVPPATLFVKAAAGDLRIRESAGGYVTGKGAASTGVATDVAGLTRSTTAPTIGAYEDLYLNTAPVISSHGGNASAMLQVPENTTAVTTMAATDADPGTVLVYSLAGGEDAAKFTVNSSTGELNFITAPDFEQPGDANGDNAYIVGVQVSDGDTAVIQRFKIKITDANDHAPVITSYNGDAVTLRVPENTTGVIATVKATDRDKNATITYSLVSEDDAAKLMVNGSTGELKFVAAPDFEQPADTDSDNVYIVTVKASDGDSSATQRFKIKIQNVNDHAPVITSRNGKDTVVIQLTESIAAVDTVTATDADAGTAIRYSILSGDDGALFIIDPVTGVLKFMAAPDYEQPLDTDRNNTYAVTVRASDGDSTDTQRFEILVTNDNDNPLVITTTMQIAENTLVVTTLGAADADAGVTVSIGPGGDGALFSLDPATGVLSFITAPDFENPVDANADNVYVVTIRIFDGRLSTILTFNISITDTDGAAARATGRTAGPEPQAAIVLQMTEGVDPGKAIITAYPNPVTGKKFSLQMDGIAAGRYTMELYSSAGQLVCRQLLNHAGKPALYPVQLPAHLSAGTYILKVRGAGTGYTEKLIVQ